MKVTIIYCFKGITIRLDEKVFISHNSSAELYELCNYIISIQETYRECEYDGKRLITFNVNI